MNDTEKLLPCPFCGGEVSIKARDKRDVGFTIWCECSKCHAETSGYCPDINNEDNSIENIENCKQLAIQAWNKRV